MHIRLKCVWANGANFNGRKHPAMKFALESFSLPPSWNASQPGFADRPTVVRFIARLVDSR